MKKYIFYIGCFLTLASNYGCEDFLNRETLNKPTNDSYWSTETSLRTYAQDFYSHYFTGYGADYTVFGGFFSGDDYTDDFLTLAGGNRNFPASATTDWNAATSTGIWADAYDVIYKANAMMAKIPDMSIPDAAKNHWMGVARFFRAMAYSSVSKAYGGVPYFDKVIVPTDTKTLYKDRDPYPTVAQNILDDFNFALDNVRASDGKRQVNKYWVAAFMSRELLYHATWLKYHGTTVGPTSQKVDDTLLKSLLDGTIRAADTVMKSGLYSIGNDYNAIFSSDDLADNKEVIVYREYTSGVQCNSLMSYNAGETHTMGDVTQDVINSYLCSDGLPIGQSPLYRGASSPNVEVIFQNRDPRLYQTVLDSLRIDGDKAVSAASPTGYCTKKFLNETWWAAGSNYCKNINSPADAPQIRYAEVLLNYVEARYEISKLGGAAFVQADLDNTINVLRKRKLTKYGENPAVVRTMPTVSLSINGLSVNGTIINDPARDQSIDPILWEIRRERRVELIMEGRRGQDLRRWAKWEYINSDDIGGNPSLTFLGAYITRADYPKLDAKIKLFDPADPTNENPAKGYIQYLAQKNIRVFKPGDLNSERYYLRAIPATQITTYKDKGFTLTQNPGWE